MEILRLFVDPLENLYDPLLVFFAFQNFLPRCPPPHLAKYENIIDEYPAQHQNRNVHEVALTAPSEVLYHLPWHCLVLVYQRHIYNSEAFRSSSHQFIQCDLAVDNSL